MTLESSFEKSFRDQTPDSYLLAISEALNHDLLACAGFFFKHLSDHCVSPTAISAGVAALNALEQWSLKNTASKVFQPFGFDFSRAAHFADQPNVVMCTVNAVGQILHRIPAKRKRGEKGKIRPFWESQDMARLFADRHCGVAISCNKLLVGKILGPTKIHLLYKFFYSEIFPGKLAFVSADDDNGGYWTKSATDDEKWFAGKYASLDVAKASEQLRPMAKNFLRINNLDRMKLQGFASHAKDHFAKKFGVPRDVLKTGDAVTQRRRESS